MAQQKKTDTGDTSDAWESLTENRKQFVVNLASGMTNMDAYKNAGFSVANMSDASISVEASRLKNSPKVSLVLAGLAADRLDSAICTKDDHLKELARLRTRAELDGNYGAAVQAEQLRGKVAGLYIDKTQEVPRDAPSEVLDRIASVAGDEVAAKFAQQKGVDWKPKGEETVH